jgi:hypothetical protein
LAPRPEPYWRSIDQGAHLGYYSGRRGGSRVARLYLGGRYRKTALGTTDDVTDGDSVAILSFSQAQAIARSWFSEAMRNAAGLVTPTGPFTVDQAIDEYLADYHQRGGKSATDTESRVKSS